MSEERVSESCDGAVVSRSAHVPEAHSTRGTGITRRKAAVQSPATTKDRRAQCVP